MTGLRFNQLQLQLNERRNQYNLEMVDSKREAIEDMERISSQIEAAKKALKSLLSQSDKDPSKNDATGTAPQKKRPRRF